MSGVLVVVKVVVLPYAELPSLAAAIEVRLLPREYRNRAKKKIE
jgi:hypothetical protein